MKHTKILATYGPSIASVEVLHKLMAEGVNAFRVNCSHGDKDDFLRAVSLIREASSGNDFPAGLLFDISGPKLRLDRFKGEIDLEKGDNITISAGKSDIKNRIIGVNHPEIISSVRMDERIILDDGNLILKILKIDNNGVLAEACNKYKLLPAKGINLPDTEIKIPTITKKDRDDIRTAVEAEADFIALSFVRSGDDIVEARELIKNHGGQQKIIAKLEKREAIENLDVIIQLSDGIMIARGDLGVELPPAELPRLQKQIIKKANRHHCPVIVATQMLESMRFSPRATRAEINDVASAVFDHADVVMLSAETASGEYPLEAVRVMTAAVNAAEFENDKPKVRPDDQFIKEPIAYSIAGAVSSTNQLCKTKAIFAMTTTGYTAGLISTLFQGVPIIALTADRKVMNQLTLHRSVYAIRVKQMTSFTEVLQEVNEASLEQGLADKNDRVIITGGYPFGKGTETNFMMIHIVG
ncbi:MAG: pyruvate kinase [candidate division Zixibacteria bacterium]|nr:pyruvate kinase [candidate division Zixibacteria bacterium]